MPPSVIRGEIVQIEAIVYNYLDTDLNEIRLTLDRTSDFHWANGNEATGFKFENITTDLVFSGDRINSQSAKAFRFFLKPLYIGTFSLTIRAQSSISFDAERKSIRVKSEGISEFTSMSNLIDLRNTNNYIYNFEMKTPSTDVVIGSEHCSIQLVGDILGPAFNNLDNLLMKPYGCGEQTMLGLTPNIFALKYLLSNSPNNLNAKTKVNSLINKATENIIYGYQNELKYMHPDGSFSAFGSSDPSGSSWLTAFVVKSFAWAKKYINNSIIEDRIIRKSIDWLISQQNTDGSFQEPGKVIHKDMQGGVNSKLTISAYITISLIEAQYEDSEVIQTIIDKGISYLESRLKQSELDIYSLTLITYALNLHNSNLAEFSFNQLKKYASNNIPGQMYWSSKESQPEQSLFASDYHTPSADVEITGYALLVYILRNQSSDALSIAKWLISKSNSLGAYSSTQNTIIALQSLSEFSISLKSRSNTVLDMAVEISFDNASTNSKQRYTLNEDNSLVLQVIELPNCNSNLTLSANGSGIAIFQAIMNYNLVKKQIPIDFYLKQEVLVSNSSAKNNEVLPIRTCVGYNQFDSEGRPLETGMAIVESGILAGYDVDMNKLIESNRHVDNLKMVELTKENNLAFYFDNIKNQVTCIEWKLYKTYTVANIQAVPVRVYDYYKPQEEASILFGLKSADPQISRLVNSSAKIQNCIILYTLLILQIILFKN
jgi:CD109 antigen